MTVITREFINKHIKYVDTIDDYEYSFDDLSHEIDFFKNLFQSYGVDGKTSKSIVIGFSPGLQQTACIFACFELSITICIIDYGRSDNFTQYQYMDPKTELLLPIDFFIVADENDTDKFNYFNSVCDNTIVINKILKKDYTTNNVVLTNKESIIMRCTSSGTTGTPKIVEHNHQFIYYLSHRNSKFYDGIVAIVHNLNHGSSFATFFLPALCSQSVEKIFNFNQTFTKKSTSYIKMVDHIMIPYSYQILEFLKISTEKNIIYTLGTIPSYFLKYYQNKKVKDIISFFGSNETSGPTLVNRLSNTDFSSSDYQIIDNFYFTILKSNNVLDVKLPYYKNKIINTKDMFNEKSPGVLKFLGRSDLTKINGRQVSKIDIHNFIKQEQFTEFDVVYDIEENLIYLVFWTDYKEIDKKIKKINKNLAMYTDNLHQINKYAILNKIEFITGVKIDNELIRHYFRKYVD